MLETEIAFAELDDVMILAEALICTIMTRVLANRRSELATLGRSLEPWKLSALPFRA